MTDMKGREGIKIDKQKNNKNDINDTHYLKSRKGEEKRTSNSEMYKRNGK